MKKPPVLRCMCCGCTDERACAGGCSWLIKAPVAICSACAPGENLRRAIRFMAVYFETQKLVGAGREVNIRKLREELQARGLRPNRQQEEKR